jgi:2-polyprenyl-6-methoxyphenol hydroxylase-like FAD-dependent oxidoreductase
MHTEIPDRPRKDCAVVIVGAGPCGLLLAIELGRRNISTVVLEEKVRPSRFPSANATQARTMEHYRRLGFAEKVRAKGLPPDYPTDIAYFTRFTKHELARINLPSARQASEIVRTLTGSWSAAELPHRVSQIFVEDVLREEAAALPSVSLRAGWRMTAVRDHGGYVEVRTECSDGSEQARLLAAYAVGADGAGSPTRKTLAYNYVGEGGVVRDFLGGRMFALHIRSPHLYDIIPYPRAWMYWAVNPQRRALMPSINGRDEFTFHTQLQADERPDQTSVAQAQAMFQAALGAELDVEIIARSSWNAGYTLVAEKFQSGRVFLCGDAAHLFTPTGGLGYNTAVEDAVNLGWKLAAVLKGWGGPALLESYEIERQALARRNTNYARRFADSVGLYVPPVELEDDTAAGRTARKIASDHFNYHARFEFNIPGITFGGRYDGSPIVVADGTTPPLDKPNEYVPTGCPGGRAPHLWLDDEHSLYDAFGFEFTLVRLGAKPPDATPFRATAQAQGLPLKILDINTDKARDLYGADLALVRPDQIVAWRGNVVADAAIALRQASGHDDVRSTPESGHRSTRS